MRIEILAALVVGFSILPFGIILATLAIIRTIENKRTRGMVGGGSILLLVPAYAAAIGFNVYGASLYRWWWYMKAPGDTGWGGMAWLIIILGAVTLFTFFILLARLFDW